MVFKFTFESKTNESSYLVVHKLASTCCTCLSTKRQMYIASTGSHVCPFAYYLYLLVCASLKKWMYIASTCFHVCMHWETWVASTCLNVCIHWEMNVQCLQSSSEEWRLLEVSATKATLRQIRKLKKYQPHKTLLFFGQLNITFINEQLILKKN